MNIRFCISLLTKYFALDQYEKETDSTGNVRELYYISGADGVVAVLEKKNNQDSIFYIHKDYLGSYEVISNQNGTVKERYNFDPCLSAVATAKAEGRRRNPSDWSYDNVSSSFFIGRGFTGHEHCDQFGLINMLSEAKSRSLRASGNGRVYDPLMAMFLSPDNFVQSPDLTQNFNRYTYCLNNPLLYSDPSGMTYYKLVGKEWVPFEYNPFQGGDPNIRTASGGGICLDNSPDFDTFMASKGYIYATNEYGIGAWIPKSERTEITWLYFAGTKDNPYQSFTGYDTSDGTQVRFFNNNNVQRGGWLDNIQTGLDVAGIADPTGIVDGVNALIYAGRGQWGNAGISALAIIPYIGDAGKAGRLGIKVLKVIPPDGFKHVKQFGYPHGQKVYEYNGKYFSKDIDSHNGGVWKVFEEVNGKLKRIGTADENLKIFKD